LFIRENERVELRHLAQFHAVAEEHRSAARRRGRPAGTPPISSD
jgi:hypothetical protein